MDGQAIAAPSTSVPLLLIQPTRAPSSRPNELQNYVGWGSIRGGALEGAGHNVWYGFFDEFMGTLDDWLSEQPVH